MSTQILEWRRKNMNTIETQLEFHFMKPEQLSLGFDTNTWTTAKYSFSTKFTPSVIFKKDGKQVGVLSWENGPMTFEGDADESAQLFFDNIIKRYVQSCMKFDNSQEYNL